MPKSITNAEILEAIQSQRENLPCKDACDKITILTERITMMLDKVEAHDIALRGNGKEGLVSKVSKLEDKMGSIIRLTWIVIGVVVPAAVGAFIYLIATHPAAIMP